MRLAKTRSGARIGGDASVPESDDGPELLLSQDAFVLVALHAAQAVIGPAVLTPTGSWQRVVNLKGTCLIRGMPLFLALSLGCPSPHWHQRGLTVVATPVLLVPEVLQRDMLVLWVKWTRARLGSVALREQGKADLHVQVIQCFIQRV